MICSIIISLIVIPTQSSESGAYENRVKLIKNEYYINENAIPTAGLHTIEHLLAGLLRDRLDGVIDCSPFGCRTGFHLITWGEHSMLFLSHHNYPFTFVFAIRHN